MHWTRLALLGLLWLAVPSQSEAATIIGQVSGVKGTVYRERSGQREQVAAGAELYIADAVATGVGSKARVTLNDGTVISVGESGKLTIAEYQSASNGFTTKIQPEAGTFRFANRPLANGRFEVETESAVAAVRGTVWLVDVTAEKTAVAVLQGTVSVKGKGSAAGQGVTLDKPNDGTDVGRNMAPTMPKTWGQQRLESTIARSSFD